MEQLNFSKGATQGPTLMVGRSRTSTHPDNVVGFMLNRKPCRWSGGREQRKGSPDKAEPETSGEWSHE
jgi:hypothetical protein